MRGLYKIVAPLAALLLIAGSAFLLARPHQPRRLDTPPRVEMRSISLTADGWDSTTLTIEKPAGAGEGVSPKISFDGNPHSLKVEDVETRKSVWDVYLRAGVLPGMVPVHISLPNHEPASVTVRLEPATSDELADGTPDFLRLDDPHDQEAFRRWFTFLAEEQYFSSPSMRPAEIVDCSALVRYAYRETLRPHDSQWASSSHLFLVPAIESVQKYNFPYTPMGSALFRVRPGPFRSSDVSTGAFAEFADAETLQRYDTYRVGRDIARALPGDLLFFRRESEHMPYHTMIVIGPSQISGTSPGYVVYHTGPADRSAGEMKRLSIDELSHYPDPQWRPTSANPTFLGVYRWNILRQAS